MRKRKIVYVINHVTFFVSHRLPIAVAALREGYEVHLVAGQEASKSMSQGVIEAVASQGILIHRLPFNSSSVNPITEVISIYKLLSYIRTVEPDLVHCASPKGVLYGGLASRLARVPSLLLAISGMGFISTDSGKQQIKRYILRRVYTSLLRFVLAHRGVRVIVQNRDDERFLKEGLGLESDKISTIRGSGVNLSDYPDIDLSTKSQEVVFASRMLKDKGVLEFIQAAEILANKYPSWKFTLVGAADYENPSAISGEYLKSIELANLKWKGHINPISKLLLQASIVCLPSYREGLPKILLEAAAAGCAIVTTDVIGCREAIVMGKTGILVPPHDPAAIRVAIESLMLNKELRQKYGASGRSFARSEFGLEQVIAKTLKMYSELFDKNSIVDEK